MPTPFIGELKLLSFNFPPKTWALANGQTLAINQNQALFSLLGTTFGGNGTSTFQLPNMQSRVPIHSGTLQGGDTYDLGEIAGLENVTIDTSTMPQHNHTFRTNSGQGLTQKPFGNQIAKTSTANVYDSAFVSGASGTLTGLNPASIQPTNGSQPHSNLQPYLTVSFCIALQGIFPSRN